MLEWAVFTAVCMFAIVCLTVVWGIRRYIRKINTRYEYRLDWYCTVDGYNEIDRAIISKGANGYEPESFTVSNETIYIMYRREL